MIKTPISNFHYLDNLPVLVVGIKIFENYREDPDIYTFKSEFSPLLIAHQTAGVACHQHYIQGFVLDVKPAFSPLLEELDHQYYGTDMGLWRTSLDELVSYNNKLKQYSVQCQFSYRNFEEGIYPIDLDMNWLKAAVNDNLPDELDDMIKFKDDGFDEFCGSLGRWGIYILGKNSD